MAVENKPHYAAAVLTAVGTSATRTTGTTKNGSQDAVSTTVNVGKPNALRSDHESRLVGMTFDCYA